MKKRVVTFIMALVMVLSLLPCAAWAEVKSGTMVNNISYSYNTGTKVLTVSGSKALTGNGYATPFKTYANLPVHEIEKVVIKSGVTGLDSLSFADFFSLETITIPDTVTYIGSSAFLDCYALKSITIPAKVTKVEQDTFSGCESLASVTILGPITKIDVGAFQGLVSLKTVTFPDKVGKNARIESQAFDGCSALESIVIPEGVYCVADSAFKGCESLRSVTFPDTMEYIEGSAFYGCSQLRSVEIPESISVLKRSTFNSCTSLQSVSIPSAVETMEALVFADCSSLKSVTFCGDAPDFGNNVFRNVTATVYYPAGNKTWTASVMTDYGGNLTWKADCSGAHSFGDWVYADEDCHKRSCSACGYEETEDHNYIGSVCDSCGDVFLRIPSVTGSNRASDGKPSLKWDAVDGAAKYYIYRATSKTGTYKYLYATTKTSYNNTSAVAGKTYYYKVVAVDAAGNKSDYSAVVSRTCDLARPEVKATIKAASGKPYLTWAAVDGADKYEVYRATSKNGTYTKMYTTTNTYYTNTSAKVGTTYYYKVKAVMNGNSYATSAYSPVKYITCDCARPVVSITSNSAGKPKLSWDAVSGATKYEIWRATSKDGEYTKAYTTTKTSYTNTGAVSGTTYYYKVRALGSSTYATSAFSSVVSIQCK